MMLPATACPSVKVQELLYIEFFKIECFFMANELLIFLI